MSKTEAGDCAISTRLALDVVSPGVECLERRLTALGLFTEPPDETFDAVTQVAVEAFQQQSGVIVDGIVGPQSAGALGVWVGGEELPPDPSTCAGLDRMVVVDRFYQRAWTCQDGAIVDEIPITSSWNQPDPGTYNVLEKDLEAASILSGEYSEMTHFVVFAEGEYSGARVGFHSMPTYRSGAFVQPLDTVGDLDARGASSGCIRLLPEDADMIWDFINVGDRVVVIT